MLSIQPETKYFPFLLNWCHNCITYLLQLITPNNKFKKLTSSFEKSFKKRSILHNPCFRIVRDKGRCEGEHKGVWFLDGFWAKVWNRWYFEIIPTDCTFSLCQKLKLQPTEIHFLEKRRHLLEYFFNSRLIVCQLYNPLGQPCQLTHFFLNNITRFQHFECFTYIVLLLHNLLLSFIQNTIYCTYVFNYTFKYFIENLVQSFFFSCCLVQDHQTYPGLNEKR